MTDDLDELMVSVRADTRGFAQDIGKMKNDFDGTLLSAFDKAGGVLEKGLLSALKKGSLGFEDLKRMALSVIDEIAGQALRSGIGDLLGGIGKPGGGAAGSPLGALGSLASSLLGLPGRATGGLVAPDRPYLVGERGPELFVPTSAGRVEANGPGTAMRNDVRVAINLAQPRGTDAPAALQRSSRQVASAVRRALSR
ncbi:tail tape measure protein [Erythrobacter litoralis]|uniref:tail tape measure protein n=1 Tax=Erythrobacter litoralis TaxID=39960 RepID=UPI002434D02F|nr:tail tape measure protein [Erythrobacter litoralis]MDG6079187.1 tail tape measure protein [Erythrobacter litoralis]